MVQYYFENILYDIAMAKKNFYVAKIAVTFV